MIYVFRFYFKDCDWKGLSVYKYAFTRMQQNLNLFITTNCICPVHFFLNLHLKQETQETLQTIRYTLNAVRQSDSFNPFVGPASCFVNRSHWVFVNGCWQKIKSATVAAAHNGDLALIYTSLIKIDNLLNNQSSHKSLFYFIITVSAFQHPSVDRMAFAQESASYL